MKRKEFQKKIRIKDRRKKDVWKEKGFKNNEKIEREGIKKKRFVEKKDTLELESVSFFDTKKNKRWETIKK